MIILISFIVSFCLLIFVVLNDIHIAFGLLASYLIFAFVSRLMGKTFNEIKTLSWNGGKRSFVVLKIFILIGLVTASWMIAGTIPSIVYYSMKIMNPKFFILFAFLSSSLVSYMLGTSFGTASTIGVVLMIMARGGDINLNIAAGAVLSGCYVGDRASPMSSCANLVANQTQTDLYPMLKKLRHTALIPLIATSIIYLFLSFKNPLTVVGNNIISQIQESYNINFIALVPALVMLILSGFQYNVKKSMAISVVSGAIVAFIIQNVSIIDILKTLISGYKLDPSHPLVNLMKGGGLFANLKAGIVIFISCSLAGLLEGLDIFKKTGDLFTSFNTRSKVYISTALTSIASASFGGNQSIAVVMVSGIIKELYKKRNYSNYDLATDIANTTVLIAPMIPWNIAVLIPATIFDVEAYAIVPYAFYLSTSVIINYLVLRVKEIKH